MFGALKKLFSKSAKEEQLAPTPPPDPARAAAYSSHKPAAAAPSPAAPSAPARAPGGPASAAAGRSASTAPSSAVANIPAHETIAVQLTAVVPKLPANISTLAIKTGGVTFHLSARVAVEQLATGKVRIPFGEMRRSVPPGTFAENASQDDVMVEIPLAAVLAGMNPALLARRSQRKVDVPEDVTSIFGPKFKMKSQAAVAAPASAPAAAAPVVEPTPAPAAPPPPPLVPTPAPLPPVTPLASAAAPAIPRPPSPVRPPTPQKPVAPSPSPLPFAQKPGAPSPGKLPSMGARPAAPASPPPPPAPVTPISPIAPAPAAAAAPIVPAAPAQAGVVQVPLSDIMTGWPDPVRQEIAHGEWDLSMVVIPVTQLEGAMKTGHVVFTWGDIRKLLNPPPSSAPSPNDSTPLELPLKIIAPLFMAARMPSAQRKVTVGGDIPDVFVGLKKGAAQAAPAAPAAPTAPAIPAASASAPAAPAPAVSQAPKPDALGVLLGQPLKADWQPPEIVQKISAMAGVAGCVITTGDGLMIAGQVPPPQKADMLASFLPQIFARMTQYCGEMQLGGLNAMHLFTADAPCVIFKAGKLYLGVTGRPGATLPDAQLLRIATELGKRNP